MRYIVGIALALTIVGERADGQEREIDILFGNILELISEEGADIDDITAHYEELFRNPLDLNRAGTDDLQRLIILNDFQIESLLAYRRDYGPLFSVDELAYIDGFDERLAKLLSPFLIAGNVSLKSGGAKREFKFRAKRILNELAGFAPITREEFIKKPESRYIGSEWYTMGSFEGDVGSNISFNITAENDVGELVPLIADGVYLPDFVSGSLQYNSRGKLTKLIVGDYHAGFGQGLVFKSGFSSIAMQSDPLRLKMNPSGFTRFKSTSEQGFMRGIAASVNIGKTVFNLGVALNSFDAKTSGGSFSTIYETGEHNTPSKLSNKDRLRESVFIFNSTINLSKLRVSFTNATFGFNLKDGRNYSEYSKYRHYNGIFGNAGVDFVWQAGSTRVFGELAADYRGNPAAITGVTGTLGQYSTYGLLARYYSKSFNAPHASAYTRNSGPNNEIGVKLSLLHHKILNSKLFLTYDFTRFPGPRYQASRPSSQHDLRVELKNDKSEYCTWDFSTVHRRRVYDISGTKGGLQQPFNSLRFKGGAKIQLTDRFSIAIKGQSTLVKRGGGNFTKGFSIFQEGTLTGNNGNFTLRGRVGRFTANSWDNRIYTSESDITSLYSMLNYGAGWRAYLFISTRPFPSLTVKVKYSCTSYTDRDKTGEGLTLAEGPSRHELKMQFAIRF